MSKVVLWRRADPMLKGGDDGDGVTFTRAELDRLAARGEADPGIQALVKECVADPGSPTRPTVAKGPRHVAVRKQVPPPAGERLTKLEAGIAELDAAVATAKAEVATTRAYAAVDEVMKLCKRGDRGAVAEAGALLRDPAVYAAYRHRLAGVPFAVPVEKAAPDHRAAIRKLASEADFDGLDALLRSPEHGLTAHEQYRELQVAGGLRWPTDALRKSASSGLRRRLAALHEKACRDAAAARELRALLESPEARRAWDALAAEGKVKPAAA